MISRYRDVEDEEQKKKKTVSYTWRRLYDETGDRVAGGPEFMVVLQTLVLIVGAEWRVCESLDEPSRHLSTVK